jgi:hypothetical protein
MTSPDTAYSHGLRMLDDGGVAMRPVSRGPVVGGTPKVHHGPIVVGVHHRSGVPTEWMWRYPSDAGLRHIEEMSPASHSIRVGDQQYDDH